MVGISCIWLSGTSPQPSNAYVSLPALSVIERMPTTWSNGTPTSDGAIAPITSCGDAVMIHTSKPLVCSAWIRSFCCSLMRSQPFSPVFVPMVCVASMAAFSIAVVLVCVNACTCACVAGHQLRRPREGRAASMRRRLAALIAGAPPRVTSLS
jgi:hypothetical protein